ncbi:MAG: hypothetical protein HZC42_14965 [Candidatus Eisenbacteria bacterium]|nr:hypothetical protein [Candidatus Eisenbacteria bacterium]
MTASYETHLVTPHMCSSSPERHAIFFTCQPTAITSPEWSKTIFSNGNAASIFRAWQGPLPQGMDYGEPFVDTIWVDLDVTIATGRLEESYRPGAPTSALGESLWVGLKPSEQKSLHKQGAYASRNRMRELIAATVECLRINASQALPAGRHVSVRIEGPAEYQDLGGTFEANALPEDVNASLRRLDGARGPFEVLVTVARPNFNGGGLEYSPAQMTFMVQAASTVALPLLCTWPARDVAGTRVTMALGGSPPWRRDWHPSRGARAPSTADTVDVIVDIRRGIEDADRRIRRLLLDLRRRGQSPDSGFYASSDRRIRESFLAALVECLRLNARGSHPAIRALEVAIEGPPEYRGYGGVLTVEADSVRHR